MDDCLQIISASKVDSNMRSAGTVDCGGQFQEICWLSVKDSFKIAGNSRKTASGYLLVVWHTGTICGQAEGLAR